MIVDNLITKSQLMAEPESVSSAPLRLAQLNYPNIAFGHVTAKEENDRRITYERRQNKRERGKEIHTFRCTAGGRDSKSALEETSMSCMVCLNETVVIGRSVYDRRKRV